MAQTPKRDKSTAPSRNKRGGGGGSKRKPPAKKVAVTPTEDTPSDRGGLPARAERQGSRRIHSRKLSGAESRKRDEREAARRDEEVTTQRQQREERQPKGWAGLRATRGAPRGR